jgi:CBS domain-containing protein
MRAGDLMCRVTETVLPDHPLREASDRMERGGLPCLPVVDGDEIVGMIVAADLHTDPRAPGGSVRPPTVRERMSSEFAFCYENDDLETARQAVAGRDDICLCVTDGKGRLVGVISREALSAATGGDAAKKASSSPGTPGAARRLDSTGHARPGRGGRPRGYSGTPRLRD